MIKLSDYVIHFLAGQGIKNVFGVTGGAVVHFFDSAAKYPGMEPIFTHHEQAAAFSAHAYARVTNNLGAAFVTTGPGGTNALTGVCAAWLDSIPCFYISGQARLEHTTHRKPFRQLGSQQIDIVTLVGPITKYAVMIEDVKMIKYELQKALHIATTGRPGPVWVDIPLNFQWAMIEPDQLPDFDPLVYDQQEKNIPAAPGQIDQLLGMLKTAKRPLVVAGYGIRLSKAEKEFKEFIQKSGFSFVSTWNTCDLLPTDEPRYMGRLGIIGQRGANLAVQNCDLVIGIGSHLSLCLTGTNFGAFAREAKVIMVDIDKVELENQTVRVDLGLQMDVKKFFQNVLPRMDNIKLDDCKAWHDQCERYKKYNEIPQEWHQQKEFVNPYVFLDTLSDMLEGNEAICIDGGGTVLFMSFQGLKIKEGQRLIVSSGIGAMGSGLPESVGACFANDRRNTICLVGDGSFQFNVHELQTIVHHQLPVKIFVLNNDGYLSIRQTQDGFLGSRHIGSSAEGGISLPDIQKIAHAYGIKSVRINDQKDMASKIRQALQEPGPVVFEAMVSREQPMVPRMGFVQRKDGTFAARPLEDMEPLLPREEFRRNMLVKPMAESNE